MEPHFLLLVALLFQDRLHYNMFVNSCAESNFIYAGIVDEIMATDVYLEVSAL